MILLVIWNNEKSNRKIKDITKFNDNKIARKRDILVELSSNEVREKRELGMNFRRLSGDCQQLLIVRGDVTDMISCGRIDREEVYDDAAQHNSNK